MTFPLAVGATTVLMAERPTPDAVFKRLTEKKPTIFYGVPTLYAALLASPDFSEERNLALRVCTSAGEALPAEIGKRWTERTGTEILDGIGSTEMLHIFLSNRPGDVRHGTTGKPVPGYQLRLVDDSGNVVTKPGELGELQISGPTSAIMYWNQREKTKNTFQGPWTRSGDKYAMDEDGYFAYGGRSDDMLKVGGIYVSPVEVEAALITHEAVLEVRRRRRRGRVEAGQAQGLRRPEAGPVADRLAEGGACSSTSRTGWRPTSTRGGSSSSTSCRRPRPGRSRGSSCDEDASRASRA